MVLSHSRHLEVEGNEKSSCLFYTLMSCHVLRAVAAVAVLRLCRSSPTFNYRRTAKVSKARKEHNLRAEVWHHECTLAAAEAWFRLAGLLIRIISHWQLQSPQCKFSAGWIRRITLATFFSLVCAWIKPVYMTLSPKCWALGGLKKKKKDRERRIWDYMFQIGFCICHMETVSVHYPSMCP